MLPWETRSFDLVTGFSAFQFADDKVRALSEAGRVSRDLTAVIIPTRVASSGIAAVFKPLLPLFPSDALEGMRDSGMFALSEAGRLDEALADAALTVVEDDEIEFPVAFDSVDSAARAFLVGGHGPAVAVPHVVLHPRARPGRGPRISAATGVVGAGPMALAIVRSGEEGRGGCASVVAYLHRPDGHVSLAAWYRVVLARAERADLS